MALNYRNIWLSFSGMVALKVRTGGSKSPGIIMNADLESKNYYVILGRVPTRYVEDKIYGLEHVEQSTVIEEPCKKNQI